MASIKKRTNGQWRARYRDAAGKEHARHFERRVDAQRWLDETTTSIVSGVYVDPKAGKATVREYAKSWQASQTWRPTTELRVDSTMRNHVLPTFGDRPIASVRPSEVQAWTKRLSVELSPQTVRTVYAVPRSLMGAAVLDRVIAVSPCVRVSLPTAPRRTLAVPSAADVAMLSAKLPKPLAVVPYLTAGLGLRPGEVFGLEVADVDFLRRTVRVERQLDERGRLAPLKTADSQRCVPLPTAVAERLAAHLASTGRRSGLILTTPSGDPVRRNTFGKAWRSAVAKAGVQPGLRLHDLRHAYASALIAAGESVKVVQARLGHASAMVTLDVYGHLWPDSDDKTRAAIDAFLAPVADSVRTAEASSQVSGAEPEFLEKS
jgi:integrase